MKPIEVEKGHYINADYLVSVVVVQRGGHYAVGYNFLGSKNSYAIGTFKSYEDADNYAKRIMAIKTKKDGKNVSI